MSGHLSNRPPITPKGALNRLVLMSLVAWALLVAASLAEHGRDGVDFARLAAPLAQAGATAAGA
jgi:hypothetical protein